jgi:hypothetical protein
MPEQANQQQGHQTAQQGHAAIQSNNGASAGPRLPQNRGSSRSMIIGAAGVLITAAAIAGVVTITGSGSDPVNTQVATVSFPAVVAQPSAPVVAPVPVAPPSAVTAPAPAPSVTDIVQSFARLAPPAPAAAPALNDPRQCQIGQSPQLALNIHAGERSQIGNRIRIRSGSYVSPWIVVTPNMQTVTFPAPPGAGWGRIFSEQTKTIGGDIDEGEGVDSLEKEREIGAYGDSWIVRWTPHC